MMAEEGSRHIGGVTLVALKRMIATVLEPAKVRNAGSFGACNAHLFLLAEQ